MKALNIRDVPESILREVKAQSAKKGVTIREFVLEVLARRVGVDEGIGGRKASSAKGENGAKKASPEKKAVAEKVSDEVCVPEVPTVEVVPEFNRTAHDVKECRLYGCMMCKGEGKKF